MAQIAKAFGVDVVVLLSSRPITAPWSEADPLSVVATAIPKWREKRGWTQEELATHAGVARDIVAKIERQSRNPTLDVLDRLAQALGCTVKDFFDSRG